MFKKSYRQAWRAEVYTALPKSDLSKVKVSVSTKNGVGTLMVNRSKQIKRQEMTSPECLVLKERVMKA